MAEYETEIFEHELKAKFEQLDAQIKIPEIPDAQSIFERAEESKGKVIPFKKYSRYFAAAAAVVLICVSIPVMGVLGEKLGISADSNEAALAEPETARDSDYYDYSSAETTAEEEPPEATEPESFDAVSSSQSSMAQSSSQNSEDADVMNGCSLPLDAALRVYFGTEENAKKDMVITSPAIESIGEELNKKRSIEINVDDGAVSVILTDTTVGEDIAAFWVEGYYQNSHFDEASDSYVITLVKPITKEAYEGGYYLPTVGDAMLGNYTVNPEVITVSGEVTEGIISLYITINLGTGEYEITGELK